MTSNSQEWETPQYLFDELNLEFKFEVDLCASKLNKKCYAFLDKQKNALDWVWSAWWKSGWLNPPFGRDVGQWIQKAYEESLEGMTVVCLVPARVDTKWFHEFVLGKAEIRFVKGRLNFSGAKHNAPFPCMILIFKQRYTK